MNEEAEPRPRSTVLEPAVMETFGIAELEAHIAQLRTEIARAEAMIDRKRGHRGLADAVFGTKR